jgi:DNA-binding response OmpR family regulator
MKVLFVQKEPLLATALKITLGKEGYEVIFCKNSNQALHFITSSQADFLIADIVLLKDALQMISTAKDRNIPVIILSKHGYEDQLQAAFDLEVDDYVSLPLSLPELSLRVKKLSYNRVVA